MRSGEIQVQASFYSSCSQGRAATSIRCCCPGKPIGDSVSRVLTAGRVGTLCLACTKISDSQKKASFSINCTACPNSPGLVNSPYQLTVHGRIPPSPEFLGATEGPGWQAGLAKDSSSAPAAVTCLYIWERRFCASC